MWWCCSTDQTPAQGMAAGMIDVDRDQLPRSKGAGAGKVYHMV